jgi:LDH2 family malate/lactate/ureidoglycolate dehydrogenase
MGSNPFAYAAPAGREHPILMDIATSAVAAGKITAAAALGHPIPAGWLVDEAGKTTTDPTLFPAHACQMPMAGHKGYGIALMIETLSGLLSGASLSRQITSWMYGDGSTPTGHGHCFVAIDVQAFVPIEEYRTRMDNYIAEIKALPKADGASRIYLPGEMEWEARERALAEGIELPDDVVQSLRGLAQDIGMKASLFE